MFRNLLYINWRRNPFFGKQRRGASGIERRQRERQQSESERSKGADHGGPSGHRIGASAAGQEELLLGSGRGLNLAEQRGQVPAFDEVEENHQHHGHHQPDGGLAQV